MLGVGIVIAIWLYVINIDDLSIPAIITLAGYDITQYAIVVGLLFIGVLGGVFVKYGLRGGRLKL